MNNDHVLQFADDEYVVFGDVMLRENRVTEIHGTNCQVAHDGWPSMRYFNKNTGYGGSIYAKQTSERICTELSMVLPLHLESCVCIVFILHVVRH